MPRIFTAHIVAVSRNQLRAGCVVVLGLVLCSPFAHAAKEKKVTATDQPIIIGWVENVRLMDVDVVQKARIDTGAGLASIDATIIKVIKSNQPPKPDRVIFTVEDGKGGVKTLEKDIVDWVNIKKKGGKGSIPRPVVKMEICIAGKKLNARVNLAERHGFLYPVLIGRNFLKMPQFLVDSRESFTHDPVCK